MTDKTNAQLLADATKQLEKVQDELNQKSERALTEASRSGQLSAETKEAVDRLMTTQNGLQESVNTLKASLGELEQEYARMPLDRAMGAAQERRQHGGRV